MERDGRESLLFYQQREQEVDKERQEEISEGEGEKRDEPIAPIAPIAVMAL